MVSMKTAEREFEFDGSDSKYIKFLEGHLVGCTCKSQLVPRHRQDGQHQISNSESKIRKIEQCTRFLKQIQPSEHWKISRKNSGLCSVRDMTWAIRFLVDDPSLQDEQTTQGIPFRRAQSPSVDSDELRRAESYSRRTADFKLDAKLLHTIIQLRDLMYRLWETVMIERERYSAETVNMISTSRGAQRHRYGGTWTSKLSSKLYAMGWGRRSFEVLAVYATSITTYATIAEVKAETTLQMVEDRLKGEEYLAEVEDEAGWITFCPACILKCLTGDRLTDICKDIGYDEDLTKLAKEIWKSDYEKLYGLLQEARDKVRNKAERPSKRVRMREPEERLRLSQEDETGPGGHLVPQIEHLREDTTLGEPHNVMFQTDDTQSAAQVSHQGGGNARHSIAGLDSRRAEQISDQATRGDWGRRDASLAIVVSSLEELRSGQASGNPGLMQTNGLAGENSERSDIQAPGNSAIHNDIESSSLSAAPHGFLDSHAGPSETEDINSRKSDQPAPSAKVPEYNSLHVDEEGPHNAQTRNSPKRNGESQTEIPNYASFFDEDWGLDLEKQQNHPLLYSDSGC